MYALGGKGLLYLQIILPSDKVMCSARDQDKTPLRTKPPSDQNPPPAKTPLRQKPPFGQNPPSCKNPLWPKPPSDKKPPPAKKTSCQSLSSPSSPMNTMKVTNQPNELGHKIRNKHIRTSDLRDN